MLICAVLLLFRSRQLTEAHLDVLLDRLHRSLKSEAFAVETQVIVAGIGPFLSGVIAVEITAVLVGTLHKFLNVFSDVSTALHGLLNAVFSRCMHEHADYVVVILQHIICRPADDDTGLSLCKFTDDLRLIVEQIVVADKLVASGRDQLSLVLAVRLSEKQRGTLQLLVRLVEQFLCDSAVLRGHFNDLVLVKPDAKILREHFSDGLSAASEMSCNRNYYVFHSLTPFIISQHSFSVQPKPFSPCCLFF